MLFPSQLYLHCEPTVRNCQDHREQEKGTDTELEPNL